MYDLHKSAPDPKLHQQISFAKSGLRILAGALLCASDLGLILIITGGLIIVSEALGIVEELV